jgi:hypothetical protein
VKAVYTEQHRSHDPQLFLVRGFDPVGDTSEQAASVFRRDYERFGTVIRELKLKAE